MKSIFQKFGLVIAAAAVMFTGCNDEEDNLVDITFSDGGIVSIQAGSTAQVEILTGTASFQVRSENDATATATVSGSTITITGVAQGNVNIIVTGSDGATDNVAVFVTARPSNAPVVNASIVELDPKGTRNITITGGTEAFTILSPHPQIASATVSGRNIVVTANSAGSTIITLKSANAEEGEATILVTVSGVPIFYGPDKDQIGGGSKHFYIHEDQTIPKGVYTMVGWIYVEDGATLTIEPGTIIKGSNKDFNGVDAAEGSTLIVQRGGKIIAEGTREEPIVFTSAQPAGQRQPSDWGGIIILGKATNNGGGNMTVEGGVDAQHGGNDDDDNSGILKFVRIEFAGYPYGQDNEINGLTLGSVGRGTTLEYIQVSYCGDDSFEWFGGTVDARYLVSYHTWDDDFDPDAGGYRGRIQFALVVRDPKIADVSNSNGIETDNRADGGSQTPNTKAIFSNVTVIGPMGQDPNFVNRGDGANILTSVTGYGWGETSIAAFNIRPGIFQAGMHIRRNSHTSVFNSVFTGFPVGLILDNQAGDSQGAADNGVLKVKNVFFAGMGRLAANNNNANEQWVDDGSFVVADYFNRSELNNTVFTPASQSHTDILASIQELGLKEFQSKALPIPLAGFAPNNPNANWGPVAGSPLLAPGATDFEDPLLKTSDNFFLPTTYAGAFANDNLEDSWLRSWTNFDPQNTDY